MGANYREANDNVSPKQQSALDGLVAQGLIILGPDDRYRTPEHHAAWLVIQEAHEASLYAEFVSSEKGE